MRRPTMLSTFVVTTAVLALIVAVSLRKARAESDDSGGDAGAAGGGDRLFEVDVFGEEEFAKLVGGFEAAVFDEIGEGDAGGSGHVAGA